VRELRAPEAEGPRSETIRSCRTSNREPAHTISIVPAFLFSVNAKMSPRARMLSYTLI
jgi:hypothetical protein